MPCTIGRMNRIGFVQTEIKKKGKKEMFDTCREEAVEPRKEMPIGSLMVDSCKMLCDLCVILNSIEQAVFGKSDPVSEKPEVPQSLQDRVIMNCDLALTCIGKAKRINESLM